MVVIYLARISWDSSVVGGNHELSSSWIQREKFLVSSIVLIVRPYWADDLIDPLSSTHRFLHIALSAGGFRLK